jgi:hypothetical protein
MVDGGGDPQSSDELIRAAREEYVSETRRTTREVADGPDSPRRDARKADSPADDGGDATRGRDAPRSFHLKRSARLVPSGTWWAKLRREEYALAVDGQHLGKVFTSMGPNDAGFGGINRLRRTRVLLPDGVNWRIEAGAPGPKRTKTTRFGNIKQLAHSIEERVVTVHAGARRLAWTEGPLATTRQAVGIVATQRRSYELTPIRRTRRGTIGRFGAVERKSATALGPWSFSTTEELPLEVALVHWHLLMGDWAAEGQYAGG